MTDFHVSLVAIGVVVVVGVISYNKWQEWRAKKSVEQAFSPMEDDVLMSDGQPLPRQEPVLTPFEGPDVVSDAMPMRGHGLNEAAHHAVAGMPVDADPDEGELPVALAEAPRKRSPLDPLLDLVIPFNPEVPLRGDKLVQAFQKLHLVGNKPVKVIGATASGSWEPVAIGGAYRSLQIGIQRITRSGVLTELEFSELATRLNTLADDLSANVELPDMNEAIADARALYQRLQDFDAKLSINVRATSAPWKVSTLKPALQRQGMELRPDGRLVMPDGEGGQLFSVSVAADPSSDTTRQITLLLPVALVAPEREGFRAMTSFAKTIASRLSGAVVDDEGQPLSDATLAAIERDVVGFYQEMENTGIPAGSPRAHRLFA